MQNSNSTNRHTLPKSEKLCSEKEIAALFAHGKSFIKFPIRFVYSEPRELNIDGSRCKILTSVPKKRFKHAVDRNRVKRLMREAYRLNKINLTEVLGDRSISLAFVYIDSELPSFERVEKSMKSALEKLCREF